VDRRQAPRPPLRSTSASHTTHPRKKMRIVADINSLSKDAKPTEVVGADPQPDRQRCTAHPGLPHRRFQGWTGGEVVRDPPLNGLYEIALRAEGENVPRSETVKTFFERKKFPWEDTPVGHSTKGLPPFNPIKVDGKTLSTVMKEHQLNDLGRWDQAWRHSRPTRR